MVHSSFNFFPKFHWIGHGFIKSKHNIRNYSHVCSISNPLLTLYICVTLPPPSSTTKFYMKVNHYFRMIDHVFILRFWQKWQFWYNWSKNNCVLLMNSKNIGGQLDDRMETIFETFGLDIKKWIFNRFIHLKVMGTFKLTSWTNLWLTSPPKYGFWRFATLFNK